MNISCSLISLELNADAQIFQDVQATLKHIQSYCRKKDVETVVVHLRFLDTIPATCYFTDRGKKLTVSGLSKSYLATADHLLTALGDLIREQYDSDPDMLDVYQTALGL